VGCANSVVRSNTRELQPDRICAPHAQSSDALCPLSFDRGSPFELQAKLREKRDSGIEGFHHDADVVHPLKRHAAHSSPGVASTRPTGRAHRLTVAPSARWLRCSFLSPADVGQRSGMTPEASRIRRSADVSRPPSSASNVRAWRFLSVSHRVFPRRVGSGRCRARSERQAGRCLDAHVPSREWLRLPRSRIRVPSAPASRPSQARTEHDFLPCSQLQQAWRHYLNWNSAVGPAAASARLRRRTRHCPAYAACVAQFHCQ
jgi:hypothetical protein